MKTATIEVTETKVGIYCSVEPGTYRVECPNYYDAGDITAADLCNDCNIRIIEDGEADGEGESDG